MTSKIWLAALLVLAYTVSAQWETCPFGLVNDTYPGQCGRYIDTNRDNICDRSQTRPTTTLFSNPPVTTLAGSATDDPSGGLGGGRMNLVGEYYLLPLSVSVVVLYGITYSLVRAKKITLLFHRRLWNTVLLFSFLVCGISGMLIALRLDLRWNIPETALLSYWHIETGIAMTIVSVFHVLWHWRYFMNMVSPRKTKDQVCE